MNDSSLELDVQLTATDLYYLNREYGVGLFSTPKDGKRPSIWLTPSVYSILLGDFIYLRLRAGEKTRIAIAVLVVIAGFSLEIWLRFEPWFDARKTLHADEKLRSATHFRLDEGGLSATAQGKLTFTSWTDIAGIVETEHLLLIRLSRTRIFILPKRCFSTESSFMHARFLAEKHGKESVILQE